MSQPRRPRRAADDAATFEANLVEFVRSFGLLQPDRTPCGQPLHVSQAHALALIANDSGISQHDLTVSLDLARATVSELITELCDRGWVTRERAIHDRRVQRLELTCEAGRTIAAQVADSRRSLMLGIFDPRTRRALDDHRCPRSPVGERPGRRRPCSCHPGRPQPRTGRLSSVHVNDRPPAALTKKAGKQTTPAIAAGMSEYPWSATQIAALLD